MIITSPIGMEELVNLIKTNCSNSEMYKNTSLKPNHIIAHIDKGQGRSRALEYIADMYKHHKILDFSSGRDDFVEVAFDGTYDNFLEGKNHLRDAADYANVFTAPIGIDAVALYAHRNEIQWARFKDMIKDMAKSASFVFFVSTENTKAEQELINTINELTNSRTDEIYVYPYTKDNYEKIVISMVKEDADIENTEETYAAIHDYVEEHGVNSINQAICIAESIVMKAKVSSYSPLINAECFNVSKKEVL
jgi:hypothetical protein